MDRLSLDYPAIIKARAMLESWGNGPRIYKSTLLFLAPDSNAIASCLQEIRMRMAWQKVIDEEESLGLSPSQKPIENIKDAEAHDRVFHEALRHRKDLSMQVILMWHKKLFEETKPDIAGRVRTHQVAISGSRFMPPSPVEVQPLLREFFRWYDRNKRSTHPVELAAGVHLRFVSIHPFADGNGRMGRLMMNFVLHRHGFPLLSIPYEGRRGYYNALERSQVKENDSTFIQWFFRRCLKEYSVYLKVGKRCLPGRLQPSENHTRISELWPLETGRRREGRMVQVLLGCAVSVDATSGLPPDLSPG